MEKLHVGRAGTCIDQSTDIGIARGDNAVEWRIDVLIRLKFLKPGDICLVRGDDRLVGGQGAHRIIARLDGYGLALLHGHSAGGSELRELVIGLRRLEIGTRLTQLLIDLRRVDQGEELTLFHPGADIEIPLLQVTARAGIDRRIGEGHGLTGQNQSLVGCISVWRHDIDDRHRHFLRLMRECGLGRGPASNAEINAAAK